MLRDRADIRVLRHCSVSEPKSGIRPETIGLPEWVARDVDQYVGIVAAFETEPEATINSATFHFARSAIYSIANIYMAKMAAVFMMATSMVAIHTGIAPRWLAIVGFTLAPLLLFGSYYITWIFMSFPVWVMLVSTCVLRDDFRGAS